MSFPPQPVITEDNLVVSIDTVIYFQVTDPVAATYEIANYIQAIEQLTMTTLRNIVGGMDLEQTLTSRDEINAGLRGVLDEATGKWGIRVNRVELKGIDPPPSIKDSMEKQMRADRDKRAAILTAEGQRQSAILTAEGNKQSAILTAEGDREALILRAQADRESQILRAQGEGQAIQTVFQAIHDGEPDQSLLAYQYLQMLPKIAEGDANKVWIVPSEIGKALEGLGSTLQPSPASPRRPRATASTWVPTTAPTDRLERRHDREPPAPTRPSRRRSPRPRRPPTRAPPDTAGAADRRAAPSDRAAAEPARRPVGDPLEVVAILLAGIAAGTINTVVGSGTLITFPTLLAFGFPPVIANVSNTVGLVPGRCPARSATAASCRPAPRLVRLGVGVAARRRYRRRPAADAPGDGVRRDRARAGRLGVRAGRAAARGIAGLGRRRHEAHAGCPTTARLGVAGRALAGVYGGYFGAAQGVLLWRCSGSASTTSSSGSTPPRTCSPLVVNGVAALRLLAGRRRRLGGRRADRGRVVDRRAAGRDRRSPAPADRAARR